MANNVDGESVEIAGRRLLQRKESRKIMIVMSDGSPAADGDGHCWTNTQECRQATLRVRRRNAGSGFDGLVR
ncbi:DNA polymerase III subunit alpha [Xanthomonas phage JGB6]|nr:DNA polymerase III subunit alpha [Xanthomonas phage JGB6]